MSSAAGGDKAAEFASLVMHAGKPLVGHEVKQLLVWAAGATRSQTRQATCSPWRSDLPDVALDTQIAAYILNAALRSQTLASISSERLEIELPADGLLGGMDHAALQAVAVAAVREPLETDLANDAPINKVLTEIELPLIPVLAAMESVGVAIDRADVGRSVDRLQQRRSLGWKGRSTPTSGTSSRSAAPSSSSRSCSTSSTCRADGAPRPASPPMPRVLEDLRPAHPAIDKILEWRVYTKLRSTYVEALPLLLNANTGRLHTSFHQAVASTGRLSSTDPNLQNIPIRSELGRKIRHTFVAGGPDVVLLAADYSQIELRILAHVVGRRASRARRSSDARTSIARPPRGCSRRIRPT